MDGNAQYYNTATIYAVSVPLAVVVRRSPLAVPVRGT